jgi:hypothetical protein
MIFALPAFLLFIIPGILVIFFFYFAPYSVVLGDRGVLDSLRRSIYLVKSNFWALLIRALVVIGLFLLVGIIFSVVSLATAKIPGLLVLASIIRTFVNIALGWYLISYSITLYKQAESVSDKEGKGKLLWFAIVAILGVLFASLIVGTVVKALTSNPEIKNAIMNSATGSNSSNPGSGDVLKQTYRNAFLSACGNGGTAEDKKLCTCVADSMVNKYTAQELQNIIKKYADTKVTPKELVDAAKACVPATSQ